MFKYGPEITPYLGTFHAVISFSQKLLGIFSHETFCFDYNKEAPRRRKIYQKLNAIARAAYQ